MNQSAMPAIGKMKVVRDGIVQTVAHRQFIEKIKTFLVGILGAIGMIPTLLGFILVGPMIKKLGVVKTLKITFMLLFTEGRISLALIMSAIFFA